MPNPRFSRWQKTSDRQGLKENSWKPCDRLQQAPGMLGASGWWVRAQRQGRARVSEGAHVKVHRDDHGREAEIHNPGMGMSWMDRGQGRLSPGPQHARREKMSRNGHLEERSVVSHSSLAGTASVKVGPSYSVPAGMTGSERQRSPSAPKHPRSLEDGLMGKTSGCLTGLGARAQGSWQVHGSPSPPTFPAHSLHNCGGRCLIPLVRRD